MSSNCGCNATATSRKKKSADGVLNTEQEHSTDGLTSQVKRNPEYMPPGKGLLRGRSRGDVMQAGKGLTFGVCHCDENISGVSSSHYYAGVDCRGLLSTYKTEVDETSTFSRSPPDQTRNSSMRTTSRSQISPDSDGIVHSSLPSDGTAGFLQREECNKSSNELLIPGPIGGLSLDAPPGEACFTAMRRVARWRSVGKKVDNGDFILRSRNCEGALNPPDEALVAGFSSTALLPSRFPMSYGQVTFYVDIDWFVSYMFDSSMWSDPSHVLDIFWGVLSDYKGGLASTSVSWSDVAGLIGCYSIGRSAYASSYLFWRTGWGAPYRFVLNFLRIIAAYRDFIEDLDDIDEVSCSRTSQCVGFDDFCVRLLHGKEATNNNGETCGLTVHFISYDSAFFGTRYEECTDSDTPCGEGFPFAGEVHETPAWDDWSPYIVQVPGVGPTLSSDPDELAFPADGITFNGQCCVGQTGGAFAIRFHASNVTFEAYTCDILLHYARMAYDYARSGRAEDVIELMQAAVWLSKQALMIIAHRASSAIHEMGHTYMIDGAHCGTEHSCCFDLAADRWLCKVRGILGLPKNYRELYVDSSAITRSTGCWGDTHTSCDVGSYGLNNQESVFCCDACYYASCGGTSGSSGSGGGGGGGAHPRDRIFDEIGGRDGMNGREDDTKVIVDGVEWGITV